MKGHIRERSPGHWAIVIDLRDPATGKRRRKWHSFKGNKRQATEECARLVTEMRSGSYVEPAKVTLAQFLDRWLVHIKPNVSPRTFERYEQTVNSIVPLLGGALLSKLRMMQISEAYAKALASGRKDGKGGLSARSVRQIHRTLSQALKQAVRWEILLRNPCADFGKKDLPKVDKRPPPTIDPTETIKVLAAARSRRLFIPFLLGAMCGMRRGEIVALRWKNVDLDRAQIAVVASIEQTKAGGCREKETKGSRCRTLALPALLVDELRSYRLAQAQEFLRLGVRPDGDSLVVTKEDGAGLQPRSLTHSMSEFMKGLGSKVRLHGLRHSHASHMLAANVHPKIVQERLGHSSIAITMDIYSHAMPNMQADAAAKVDAVFKAADKNAS